jgi:mannose-6-phosphate isomerase-like protein (cupin superfamily)
MKIEKPWGFERIWADTEKYVGKVIFIKKGERLSLQHHKVKDETIMIISGTLSVTYGVNPEDALESDPIVLDEGDSLHIPPGTVHRFNAILDDVYLVEVSTTELEDVVRHQDDYGRV